MTFAPDRPIEPGIATIAEVLETPFQQMLRRKTRNFSIIGFHPRQRRHESCRTEIDTWQSTLHHRPRNPWCFYPCDNSLTSPACEPQRRIIATTLLHHLKRPRPVLSDRMDHPLHAPARVRV